MKFKLLILSILLFVAACTTAPVKQQEKLPFISALDYGIVLASMENKSINDPVFIELVTELRRLNMEIWPILAPYLKDCDLSIDFTKENNQQSFPASLYMHGANTSFAQIKDPKRFNSFLQDESVLSIMHIAMVDIHNSGQCEFPELEIDSFMKEKGE